MNARRPAYRRTRLRWLLLPCLLGAHALAQAACSVAGPSSIPLGSKTSFDVRTADASAGSGESGLTCTGILGLLVSQHIYVGMSAKDAALTNAAGDGIGFEVATTVGGPSLVSGQASGNLAPGGLLTFGGPNNDVLLFVRLAGAGNVSAGVYTGSLTLRWHYATCEGLGLGGACVGAWAVSPGIGQSCVLGLCTLDTASLPGTGLPITIEIMLIIERDCRFTAADLDFGSAPFIDAFAPVAGSVQVICTKGETYTVGLSGGNFSAGGQRQMAAGANRLQYEVLRPGNTAWNDTDQRAEQSAPAAGDAAETFFYEARIRADQSTPPIGDYADTLILDVMF